MMSERADGAIKAFYRYLKTGDAEHVEGISLQELTGILAELSRFRDDWFYPMMERRHAELVRGQSKPVDSSKTLGPTFKEKIKGMFK